MAARSLILGMSIVTLLAVAGCASRPKTCYVTLSAAGQPTAEACETGPVLIVRPITETNAAFYVPPYILGALSYEGFVAPAEGVLDEIAVTDEEAAGTFKTSAGETDAGTVEKPANAAAALRRALIGEAFLMPMRGDPVIAMSDAFVTPMSDRFVALAPEEAAMPHAAPAVAVDANPELARRLLMDKPSNRIEPVHPRIDGEVRYRRPYEGMPGDTISPDLR